jgi:hypothetical protein
MLLDRSTRILDLALLGIVVAAGCGDKSPVSRPAPGASTAGPLPAAPTDVIPPDGAQLFQFMLERIPVLAAKVPCSCCRCTIGGACPPQCGACNLIGRDAYTWHQHGLSDDEIVSRVRAKYPRPASPQSF